MLTTQNTTLVLLLSFSLLNTKAQTTTFSTQGNQIVDPCGNTFIPKGVNYSLLDDWNFPDNLNNGKERSSEIIQANPNTVRIMWYVDYGNPGRPAYNLSHLDSVISRFARANIVSIIELHDFTHIHTDTTLFNTKMIDFWTSPDVLTLLDKHKSHVWLNVANEYGPAMYPADLGYTLNPNYNAQVLVWAEHYKNVIQSLRSAGIEVPIVVDAPNYSLDIQATLAHGADFVNADPLKRVILSNHAYWNESVANLQNIVNQLSALSFPVIFGEIGNVDAACGSITNYTSLIQQAENKNLGWLAWTWNRDMCPDRNMTANIPGDPNSATDGKFTSLTTYGNTIVNDVNFGLANKAQKACFEIVSIQETNTSLKFKMLPNPANDFVQFHTDSEAIDQIEIFDLSGKKLAHHANVNASTSISIQDLATGVYIVKAHLKNGTFTQKLIKY